MVARPPIRVDGYAAIREYAAGLAKKQLVWKAKPKPVRRRRRRRR